jgi:hypothetical protein
MMDGQFSEMLGNARAFLKNSRYQHQSEFRFVWRGEGYVEDYLDIECPGITEFCRPAETPQES